MRGRHKEFREDFEGVYLLRSEFPKQPNELAMVQTEQHSTEIKIFASKLFTSSYGLFSRIGLDRQDIEAIVRVYAYIYFSTDRKENYLKSYLKWRATKLLRTCDRKVDGIAEEINTMTDSQLDDLYDYYGHNDTPENILIAHEQFDRIARGIEKRPQ